VDQGRESGEHHYSRDDGPTGEAWEPEDETGEAAWDDGSCEIWDEARPVDEESVDEESLDGDSAEDDGVWEDPADDGSHTALPPKVEAWRKRTATGAVLTGFAFGLQQVFEPKQDEPAVILQTSGEPPKDLPVDADLEYGRPRHSVVNIRPWLLPGQEQAGGQGEPQSGETGANETPAGERTGAEKTAGDKTGAEKPAGGSPTGEAPGPDGDHAPDQNGSQS
jgi:hypothetical protein